jgi:hypothetical protein
MASLPYITSPGNIDRALNGIKSAAVPERVSQDFVKTILKIPGGSGDQMTSFLKKLGFAGNDGSPNDRYRRFRNPSLSGAAAADAIREAYAPLYIRNEYVHKLNDTQLLGLIVEETGQAHDSNAAKLMASCIKHLNVFAEFDTNAAQEASAIPSNGGNQNSVSIPHAPTTRRVGGNLGLNLGYTINLNLPATTDAAVFDAIFKSLKEHLLSESDA